MSTATPTSARTAVPRTTAAPTPVLATVPATPTAIASLTPSGPAPTTPSVVGTPPVSAPQGSPPSTASWPEFSDGRIGVAFRYPPACPPRYNQATLEVGPRIALDAAETQATTLDAYVDELVSRQGWRVESRARGTLGAEPTLRLEYRFGGTSRLGIAYLVSREGFVHVWQFTAGGGTTECELPATFDAVVATFRLVDIVR